MNKNLSIIVIIVVVIVVASKYLLGGSDKMQAPVQGKITSPFGNRIHPITGVSSFHNGIDISASSGTPILAPANGKIKSAWYSEKGGNQLSITHDNGMTSGFAHLSTYSVSTGDTVKKGQIIGKVGATGKVTGPHLHYVLKDNQGKYIDPSKFIA